MIINYTLQQFEEAITLCGYRLMHISTKHDLAKNLSRVIKADGYADSYPGKIRWNAYGTAYDSATNKRIKDYDLPLKENNHVCR